MDIGLSDVYEILKALPERSTIDELPRLAPGSRDDLDPIMRHWRVTLPDFPLRPVCMYMICEPARGTCNRSAIEAQDEAGMRRLMAAAHDGDRVVRWLDDHRSEPFSSSAADEALERLIGMADSADASEREAARLYRQPGGFGASCPELDLLVDICNSADGVIGARVTGAGLGGCMFAYAHRDAVASVIDQVNRRYYAPRGLPCAAHAVAPIQGAGPLALP